MEKNNWFVHVEWVVIFITLIGGFYNLDTRMENRTSELRADLTQQCQRTDRLYEMFIDLLKDKYK